MTFYKLGVHISKFCTNLAKFCAVARPCDRDIKKLCLLDRHPFSSRSSKNHNSPTVRARQLKFLRECSPHTMCHLSCVTRHVSPTHLPHVGFRNKKYICISIYFFFIFSVNKVEKNWTKGWSQSVEALLSTGPTQSSFFFTLLVQGQFSLISPLSVCVSVRFKGR